MQAPREKNGQYRLGSMLYLREREEAQKHFCLIQFPKVYSDSFSFKIQDRSNLKRIET